VIAELLVGALAAYIALGVVFGCAFVIAGVHRIDPVARKAPVAFRLLIFPGCAVLWPLLARRWFGGVASPPLERNAHRDVAPSGEKSR
jgi:hypothetical protein